MARFAIAGIQMQVSAFEENITQMGRYLSHVRQRFPWVSMVLFSELAALGPGSAVIEVRQIGDAAASRPAQISINI